ncbi:MAG: hypothetical protein LBD93_04430 [Treponema sp.]|jgi:hypothetical protein|nr:hypothetical protein [Treponema sp.]
MRKYSAFMTGILSLLLVFGFALTACDTGGDDDDSTTPFEGTWKDGDYTLVIGSSDWTGLHDGDNMAKGTYEYEGDTATFEQTHQWTDGKWEEIPTTEMKATVNGDTLTLAGEKYKKE